MKFYVLSKIRILSKKKIFVSVLLKGESNCRLMWLCTVLYVPTAGPNVTWRLFDTSMKSKTCKSDILKFEKNCVLSLQKGVVEANATGNNSVPGFGALLNRIYIHMYIYIDR